MPMMMVANQPRGHKSMPPEFKTPQWSGPNMGAMRLMNAQEMVQSRGGPVEWMYARGPGGWSGARGMAGLRGLGQDGGEDGVSITLNDPMPVDVPVIDVPLPVYDPTQELDWLNSLPTPQLTPAQNAQIEQASGVNIYQTAPVGSNNPAPSGMEWATILNQANQGILKVLVASKPGAYYQQLPNGFVLSGGGNAIGGGTISTPIGSASITGMMPLLVGAVVLFMVMGKR